MLGKKGPESDVRAGDRSPSALLSADRAVVLIAALSAFTDAIAYSFIISFAPTALQTHFGVEKENEAQTVAFLYTAFSIAAFLFLPAIGWLVSVNCRAAFLLSAACLVGASVMFALANDLRTLFIARALQGVASAGNWTASLAMLAEHFEPAELGPNVGKVFMCSSFGALSGPFVGGVIYDNFGKHHRPAAIAVAVLAGLDLVGRLVLSPTKKQIKSDGMGVALGPGLLLRNRRIMGVCSCVMLGALCQGFFRPVITTMLHAEGVSSTRIGYVFVSMAVGNGLGANLCGKMSSARYWAKRGGLSRGGQLTGAIINMRSAYASLP
jgi:MFS family permease